MSSKILILDNVRSAHNVGSLFRTADGAGVSELVLVGYTPAPQDRFGRVQPEIEKTSLGASQMIPWVTKTDNEAIAYVNVLKQDGYVVVAVEQTHQAVSMYDFIVPNKVVYILGNEIEGVGEALLAEATVHVEIPMLGKKESLNVSVAGGIVLFHKK
jgi:tRNA G18 (ribose-2'-O)-methylase SpoU